MRTRAILAYNAGEGTEDETQTILTLNTTTKTVLTIQIYTHFRPKYTVLSLYGNTLD